MPITSQQRKHLKAIAHHLKVIVMISDKGVSEGVLAELERALSDHELIKIKIVSDHRDERAAIADDIAKRTCSEIVQSVGKTAVLVRYSTQPNPKLSNLLKSQSGRNLGA